ncbi:IclR family transcriptional regulator domain-containing protein [Amycolatopsis alkalitolerans]|uniref:IclR-ED domain-containing protein n=1 Tax=Amycolatopsis alkalitolerans TaxID=2547244 RepID=A0A5C4LWE2_9PSEU|nr:IclR family transcriptional regulator C-terminal domain-containing protein [Amycolatopsis alkalitolerans]TNC22261.1 hypothetical protein FG385_26170 [Amycolatopsis alkalitolerans]
MRPSRAASGDREPIHSAVEAKIAAAHVPEEQVRQILEQEGMVRTSPNTITTVDGYLRELSRVRQLDTRSTTEKTTWTVAA